MSHDDSTEHIRDEVEQHAHGARERWISGVAVTAAFLAALAVISSAPAGVGASAAPGQGGKTGI